jgi:hypothetical protein
MMTSTDDIFSDSNRDLLIRMWERERITRDLNVKLMWENLKYFGTLISALITASVTLMGFFFENHAHPLIPILIIGLQIFIIFLAIFADSDLTERRKRFFLIVSHLLKIEALLGLYDEDYSQKVKLKEKLQGTSLEHDEYLFVHYKRDLRKIEGREKYDTDQFIRDEMSLKKEKNENQETSDKKSSYIILSNVYKLMIWTMIAFIIVEADFFLIYYAPLPS